MLTALGRTWLVVGGLALLSGCASNIGGLIAELDGRHTSIELKHVPFYSQVTDQCGPAALATILNDAGMPVSLEELKPLVYTPERQGSLQLDLVGAARQFGRIPYQIDASLEAILGELDAGRPVLVFQNLGIAWAPAWHYAVVVGYLPSEQQFVLRSGKQERLLMQARLFVRTWKRGDFWAIVALSPGEMPADPDPDRYLRSVAAAESFGKLDNAIAAYQVATEKWPDDSLAWLGFGNALYLAGELLEAGNAYRTVLQIDPADRIAMNNLAQVYLGLGCRDDALATINAALSDVGRTNPVHDNLLTTKREIMRSNAGTQCP